MDVGSSFVMDVEGQIKNSPNWYVVTTVTGAITGTLDISTYDRIRYRIITPSGVGTLIASGYITNTSSGGVSVEYKALIDSVSSNLTYIGEAPIGSNQASSIWRIQRIQTSGSIVAIEFADSNANFDNIWNNRALLSYG